MSEHEHNPFSEQQDKEPCTEQGQAGAINRDAMRERQVRIESVKYTKHHNRCLANIPDDEPIFVLRARDPLASTLVEEWARRARIAGVSPAKVIDALILADIMEEWPVKKLPD